MVVMVVSTHGELPALSVTATLALASALPVAAVPESVAAAGVAVLLELSDPPQPATNAATPNATAVTTGATRNARLACPAFMKTPCSVRECSRCPVIDECQPGAFLAAHAGCAVPGPGGHGTSRKGILRKVRIQRIPTFWETRSMD